MFRDIADYESRKVRRYENESLLVSTCQVSDSDNPYETAVKHPKYNNNKLVIVEEYQTREEALKGHNGWVKTMTAETLPKTLDDISTSFVKNLVNLFNKNNVQK